MSSEKNITKASIPYFLKKKKQKTPKPAKRPSTIAAHSITGDSTQVLSNQDHQPKNHPL